MRRCLVACWLLSCVLPASATRRLAVGDAAAAVALPSGEVLVFDAPGRVRWRRAFGPGIVSLDLLPGGEAVALLRHRSPSLTDPGADLVLERWNCAGDQLAAAAPPPGARDVKWASGGHALLVAGTDAIHILDAATLQPKRSLGAAGLGEGDCDLAVSPRDWYLAAVSAGSLWLGRSVDAELVRTDIDLSAAAPPTVRFSADGRLVCAAGDRAVVLAPATGGLPRRVELVELQPSPAVQLSSDGLFLFLAESNRVHMVRVADGADRLYGAVRRDPAVADGMGVSSRWGRVVVLHDDGQVYWYEPIQRLVTHRYPPMPIGPEPPPGTTGPTPLPLPESGPDPYRQVRRVLADGRYFEQTTEQLDLFVLDADFERQPELEDAARRDGWASLVLALVAARLNRQELVPEGLRPLWAQLQRTDLVQFANVQARAGVTPAELEAVLGPARATGIDRMGQDMRTYPLYRYGPFAIPLDGQSFPPRARVQLTAQVLADFCAAR